MRSLLLVCLLLLLAQEAEARRWSRKKHNNDAEETNDSEEANDSEVANESDVESAFTQQHNEYRHLHGAGSLTWDTEIATYAQNWCNKIAAKGKLEHSQGKYGENLAWFYGGTTDEAEIAKNAVKNWYDEIKDYDFSKPGFGYTTGHFTQVVWKGSEKLGCGMTKKGQETYVCCNYDPPGNYQNQFEQNVLP